MKSTETFVVGLTGLIASGKTLAGKVFRQSGYYEIDVDSIGHTVLEEMKTNLIYTFGKEILNKNNEVNRKYLGKIVFEDEQKLQTLNSIVHPAMKDRIYSEISNLKGKKVLINAALLFEIGLDEFCHVIIYLESPVELIIERVKSRNDLSKSQILQRIKSQRLLKNKDSKSDYILNNDGGLCEFNLKVKNLIEKIEGRYANGAFRTGSKG